MNVGYPLHYIDSILYCISVPRYLKIYYIYEYKSGICHKVGGEIFHEMKIVNYF